MIPTRCVDTGGSVGELNEGGKRVDHRVDHRSNWSLYRSRSAKVRLGTPLPEGRVALPGERLHLPGPHHGHPRHPQDGMAGMDGIMGACRFWPWRDGPR